MAEYMPVMVGVLVGLSTFALVSGGTDTRVRGAGIAQPVRACSSGVTQMLRRLVQTVGEALPQVLRANPWIERCTAELAEIPWCQALLFDRLAGDVYDVLRKRNAVAGAQRDALVGALLVLTALGSFALFVISGSLVGAAIGVPVVPVALFVRAKQRMQAEARRVEAEMPEAFASLAIALGSGHSLAQGMRFVGSHAQEPVRSEFIRVALAVECGIPAADALDELMDRLPAPGMGFVSLALKISQRTGSPLRELLAEAANMVAERIELTRRLDVKTSQVRMSARLVAGMPVAMIFVLTMLSPDFRSGLATPVGAGSVAVALALNVCAWVIIRRIMGVNIS